MLSAAVARLWGDAELTPCAASGNNRVFVARRADGERAVVKCYFPGRPGERDRLDAECRFLVYAAEVAPGRVPRLLARDDQARLAIHQFVDGSKPAAVGPAEVEQAADFVRALNTDGAAPDLPEAAEAAFTLPEHVARVEARLARLDAVTDPEARALAAELRAYWDGVRTRLAGEDLPPARRVVSPSDFGFHNALVGADGNVVFLDFEYAGWDDAAKLANDFFLQPAVPVSRGLMPSFLRRAVLGNERRILVLRPLFALRWCCILLNCFLPDMADRGRFANPALDECDKKRNQLFKASAALQDLKEMEWPM